MLFEECPGTVGQAESCAEANAAQLADLTDDEICAIAREEMAPPPAPAACEALDVASCE